MRGRAERQRRLRRGRSGELIAAWWLRLQGFRILARRLSTPVGEIDILARRGRVLAVVEVKRRADVAGALAALAPAQRRRLERAAAWVVQHRPELAELELRFDVIAVGGLARPLHLADAWRPEGGGTMPP
ncbi:hypothetical protein HRbin39_01234 [bacterium HR39]|nr:hypothetical protein HRbin39_01234 [bacterium HR39]